MRVVPLGVRGSTPAPGRAFAGFGGHTSCVAVLADGADVPHLILDAGTGLSDLPGLLGGAAFTGRIVLTHLHWDHVQGLPFCSAVDRPDARVALHVPVDDPHRDPLELLARGFSPPHFPIGPGDLLGRWRFRALLEGSVDDQVEVVRVPHKGGTAYGLRVALDGASLAYLPDHALHRGTAAADLARVRRLVDGVDLLLHDGQFLEAESALAVAYGHATIDRALALADECGVGRVVLTHHAPNRTDEALADLSARITATPGGRPVTFARQGESIPVEAAVVAQRPAGR